MSTLPSITLDLYNKQYKDRHLTHGIIEKYAKEKPDTIAIIAYDFNSKNISWKELDTEATLLAYKLLDFGFRKGDFIVTSLLFFPELIFLEFACYKIGVILAPLDLRLKPQEIVRYTSLIGSDVKGYAHMGKTPLADFSPLGAILKKECNIKHIFQYSPKDQCAEGSVSLFQIMEEAKKISSNQSIQKIYSKIHNQVKEDDGALVIFTTGSTGAPKPALLSHKNITVQSLCLGSAMNYSAKDSMVVNLPPSHVGGTIDQMMTCFFFGMTIVLLNVFDPVKTLKSIQEHKVTIIGQIPALFELEWRMPNYSEFNLSSLRHALYAGQEGTRPFLEKLSKMTKTYSAGYGLTECAGFCTYSEIGGLHASFEQVLASVGFDMPITQVSVRKPMKDNGKAGDEVAKGEQGEICLKGAQVFLGYVGNKRETDLTISKEGYLYTGDLGSKDDKGIHILGRKKFVIKPKGYQIFPTEVENHIVELRDKVSMVAVVGVPHAIYSEAVMAFVEKKQGQQVTSEDILNHCKTIAAFKRPSHVILIEPGKFMLTRSGKTDYMAYREEALKEVESLREKGQWDKE